MESSYNNSFPPRNGTPKTLAAGILFIIQDADQLQGMRAAQQIDDLFSMPAAAIQDDQFRIIIGTGAGIFFTENGSNMASLYHYFEFSSSGLVPL